MPASPLIANVSLQRGCPACGGARCIDAVECLYFLTSRPWGDCTWCDGSGWACETAPLYKPLAVFCEGCNGSGLSEHTADSITVSEISDNAKERHAAYIAALRTRVEASVSAPLAVVA